MVRSRSRLTIAFWVLLVLCSPLAHAQNREAPKQPREGSGGDKTVFLVARPEMGDPMFAHSVVLLFPASVVEGKRIVVGLILNKQGHVDLGELFPSERLLRSRNETAYFGGPVDPLSPGVLFRSSKEAKQAVRLFGNVFVSFDPDFIKEHLKKPGDATDLRLFMGRSQWSPAQLQNEVSLGAWYSVHAETNLIFGSSPEFLWHNLLERAQPGPLARAPGGALSASRQNRRASETATSVSVSFVRAAR